MGRATLINGLVATGAGVVSNKLVAATSNFISPFVASAILLILAWFVIRGTWSENYGGGGGIVDHDSDLFQIKRLRRAWNIVRRGMKPQTSSSIVCIKPSFFFFIRSHSSRAGTYTNMLRRLHVSIRLPMGPISSRMPSVIITTSTPRLHLFLIHDLHDARFSPLHSHRLIIIIFFPTTPIIQQPWRRFPSHFTRQTQQHDLCRKCLCAGIECYFHR